MFIIVFILETLNEVRQPSVAFKLLNETKIFFIEPLPQRSICLLCHGSWNYLTRALGAALLHNLNVTDYSTFEGDNELQSR